MPQNLGQIYQTQAKPKAEESAAAEPKEVKVAPKSPEEILKGASKFVDPQAQDKLSRPGLGYGFAPANIKFIASVDVQGDKKLPAVDVTGDEKLA